MSHSDAPRVRIREVLPARKVRREHLEAALQRATSYERTSHNWMYGVLIAYVLVGVVYVVGSWSRYVEDTGFSGALQLGVWLLPLLLALVALIVKRRTVVPPRLAHWRRAMVEESPWTRLVYRDGGVMALTDDGYFFSPKTRFWPLYVRPEPAPSHRVRFTWKRKDVGWELGVGVAYVKGEWKARRKIRALKNPVWFEVPDERLVEVFRATVALKNQYPRGVSIRWTAGYDAALAAVRGRGFDPTRAWSLLAPTPYERVDPSLAEKGIRRWKVPPA